MFNFDYIIKEDTKEHNPNFWPSIQNNKVGGSGSGKANALLNLINHEQDTDKTYLYAKDLYEAKYQLLINKKESTGLKYLNDSKTLLNTQMIWMIFIKTLKNIIQVKNEKYWLYSMIWLLTCLLNVSLVFITQSNFVVPKNIRLDSIHYFGMKTPNK